MSRRGGLLGLAGGLLLLEKVDDEVLVVLDEIVVQSIRLEFLAKVFPPVRVEGLERRKLRGRSAAAVEAVGRDARVGGGRGGRRRRRGAARRVWGRLVGGGMSVAAEQASEEAMLVAGRLGSTAKGL